MLALKPKAFAVLHYLVEHAGQLVTKEALLAACWPETAVGDGVLKVCIAELRKALGESAQTPQCITTVHRRGYRFVAPVTRADPSEVAPPGASAYQTDFPSPSYPVATPPLPGLLIERDAVLQALHTALQQACHGERQIVFVTGEAGIGKTVVVEAFVAQEASAGLLWVGRGQCVEQYGTGEPYLPVLEALGQLCRAPEGARVIALLRQQAPTWLVQMPWLLTPADRERLQYELQGATRERMLRELAEVLDTLTAETPLILVLEDLHWSDYATLDLLALLARRRTPARLLVLGTYRAVEVIVHDHPLRRVAQDLQRQGYARESPLTLLSEVAVVAYLAARFPEHRFPAALAAWLHQHTEGLPLFLITVVQALTEQGLLFQQAEHWMLRPGWEVHEVDVPEGLRPLLEQRLENVPVELQQVLEVASVVGVEFAAAAVAAGLGAELAQTEEQCEALVHHHMFQSGGLIPWPDGTMTVRYAFAHALYQQIAYTRLSMARRVRLHRRIGERLEQAYAPLARENAAELAEHFVRGQDTPRALQYLQQAAETAAQRYAPHAVISPLTRAMALLATLPETPQRTQQELDLQIALGSALIATKGRAAPEVEQTYTRARALCTQVGETPHLFSVLRGLCQFYRNRGELHTARELGEQLYRLAQPAAAVLPRLEAHDTLGYILFFLGEYPAARTHLEQGVALIDSTARQTLVLRDSVVPEVTCLAMAANTLWCLGYPEQARRGIQEMLAQAQALAQPYILAQAQHFAAFLHHRRREMSRVQEHAGILRALAMAQGFPLWVGYSSCWQGWTLAMQGQGKGVMGQMSQGMEAVLATGQLLSRSFCLLLLVEVVAQTGQADEGLCLLAEALVAFEASGRGDLLAEAYRLQGELLLRQEQAAQAEACFQQALAIARRQQARSWELRAAMSLGRLWQRQGRQAEARQLLAEIYDWFTEGFDTADLQEARVLLEALA
jgi:DNA-binding winged helix-turn-helix (wHTH) protein/tetratricopeptide (TPR) repeat protein